MTDKKKEYLSVLGLLLAALLWGVSYPLTKVVEDCPTFYIVSIRFLVAAAALALIFHRHFRNFHKEILKYAFLLSFCITSMYIFGTIGIKYTTSVRASFFTCLSFVIIPILNLVIYKLKLNKTIVISVLICLAGMFLLSYTADMGTFSLNAGDLLCILAATAGSLHIIFLDRVTKQENMEPILFTIFLMAFVALWSTPDRPGNRSLCLCWHLLISVRLHHRPGTVLQRRCLSPAIHLPKVCAVKPGRCHHRHGTGFGLRHFCHRTRRSHALDRMAGRSSRHGQPALYGDFLWPL